MKAVSAYTCTDPDIGVMYFVITDSGDHVPFRRSLYGIQKGEDLSGYKTARQEWIEEVVDIQPIELPEAKQ